jgi:hypothetical protein
MKTHIFLLFLLGLSCCRTTAADPNRDGRTYTATQLFINNHKFGDTNGCSSDFAVNGQSTCGHPGHVSEVTWTFLRTSPEGDVYKVTRKYPSDLAAGKIDTKEVNYAGKPLVLWQDDYQKIFLRPPSKP